MSKIKGFFANLKKSTKITLVSCGCFIAMTAVILGFFIMFPITPSDKVIASFGRESVIKKDASQSQAVTTTVTALDSIEASKGTTYMTTAVTTMRTTRRREFSVDITTGSGFYSGGNILTGVYDPDYQWTPTTTTAVDPNYNNGGGSDYPDPTEPYTGYSEYPDPTEPYSGYTENPEPITQEPVTVPTPGPIDEPATSVDPGPVVEPGPVDTGTGTE